ncbi:F0F1 ATP synthase subunit delta [Candidatus Gottesmanbacteria bacterium]|nr:F0F1 ATP synthase subunit delta [Candidatus Gottesmanbacteria bacterium]
MSSLAKDARYFVDGVTKYLRRQGTSDAMLPKVSAVLHKISSSARTEKTARVESVVVLSPKEKTEISRLLSRLLTHTVTIECTINKELIGGLRIQVGDWIVDTSLSSQVRTMIDQLTQ